jgi:hypothetical protein
MSRAAALSALATVGLCAMLSAGSACGAEGGFVDVHAPAVAVVGLPIPITFLVHGPARVVRGRPGGRVNPFDIVLRSDEAVLRFRARRHLEVARPARPYHAMRPDAIRVQLEPTVVEPGQACELVVDLTALADADGRSQRPRSRLRAGEYAIVCADPELSFSPASLRIRLVEPNDAERRAGAVLRGPAGEWLWVDAAARLARSPVPIERSSLSDPGRSQLAYVLALAGLVSDRRAIAELEPPCADATMPACCRTEMLVLRYEIELARNARDRAEVTRAFITARSAPLAPLVEQIRQTGVGPIARARGADIGTGTGTGGDERR